MLSLSVTFLLDYGLAAEYCSGFPKSEIRIFEQKSCEVLGRKSNYFVCIHICICVCIRICVCVCICICICICTCLYMYVYIYTY